MKSPAKALWNAWFGFACLVLFCLAGGQPGSAWAATYANASIPIDWIDPLANAHTRVGHNTTPYKFSNIGTCATDPPNIDDTLSDSIPIGFTFWFAGNSYTSLRINTNGRLQFNNTTCGAGTQNIGPPQTYTYTYPTDSLKNTMKLFGADLDPTDLQDVSTTTSCDRNNNSCGIYIATMGTAPYRKFVVTWYNVPEWVNYTNSSGSFTMQAILHENGEFVFQYLSLNHGGTGTGEVGWYTDSQDYDVLQFVGGTEPSNNSAIKFYIPQPVSEYRMEQAVWGSVLDTSGNARHGSVIAAGAGVAPTTTTSGKVCRGGVIANNTSATNIGAIETPYTLQTVGSQGTITFWYRENEDNLNRMLLDASGVSGTAGASRWFYAMKTSTRALKFVVYDDAGVRYQALSADNILSAAGTWDHIGVSWNFNAKPGTNQDRLILWINGTLVKTQTFTTAQPISTALTTLYIGDNRSVLGVENTSGNPTTGTSSLRGTGYSAGSRIDEVRVYNFEGGKGLIDRDRNQASACLDHYAITHAGTGTNCGSTLVTITAHDAAHNTVLMPNNSTSIQISTSTGKGDWSLANGYGTLNNGTADDGAATYLFNGEYQVVLNLAHTQAGTVNINVTDGQLVEHATEDPNLTITSCSSVTGFNACEVTTPRCVPTTTAADANKKYARLLTKLAAQAFNLDIVALKSDGALEPAFDTSVRVDLLANISATAINPTTNCPTSQTAIIPLGTAIGIGIGATPDDTAGYGKVSVSANAFSSVSPNYSAYRDVRVRFTCSATNCPPSGLINCSSDNFAVRPQDVTIAPVSPLVVNNNSYAGTAGHRQIAGSDFALTATTVAGYNGTLQFDRSSTLVESCYGTAAGCPDPQPTSALRDASGNTTAVFSTANIATGNTGNSVFQYHDAGTFQFKQYAVHDANFTAVDQRADPDYSDCVKNSASNSDEDANASNGIKFGCNLANQSLTAGPFGRFRPNNFAYVSGSVTQAAGTYSYFGQPGFALTYTVSARSLGNPAAADSIVTTRYNAATPALVAGNGTSTTDLRTGATPPIDWTPAGAGSWTNGQYTYNSGGTLVRSTTAPEGPFDDLYFAVNVAETGLDGVTMTTAKDFKLGTPACTGGTCTHRKINAAAVRARYGRLHLLNTYGSELLRPRVEYRAEYWNGAGWTTNALDNTTPIAAANLATNGLVVNNITALTNGVGFITFNVAAAGSYDIAANLNASGTVTSCNAANPNGIAPANREWLQALWSSSCNSTPAWQQDPNARIRLGSPRAPYIYLRERY